MVKKWQTLIEGNVAIKTTDGYILRLFCIGFANSHQVRLIRKKMTDIMIREVSSSSLKEVVNKLLPDSIGKDIEKACQGIYPMHDVYVRKVKILKKPKFDLGKLMELHGEGSSSSTKAAPTGEAGETVDRTVADGFEPAVQQSV